MNVVTTGDVHPTGITTGTATVVTDAAAFFSVEIGCFFRLERVPDFVKTPEWVQYHLSSPREGLKIMRLNPKNKKNKMLCAIEFYDDLIVKNNK